MANYECKQCGAILHTGTLIGDGTFHLVVKHRMPIEEARRGSGTGWANCFRLLEVDEATGEELHRGRHIKVSSRRTHSGAGGA